MYDLHLKSNNDDEIPYNDRINTNDIEFQIPQTNQRKNQKCASCLCLSGACLINILAIGMVLAYITWMVFAIKAISNTSNADIKDICKNSDMWVLMLLIIIISGCSVLSSINRNEENTRSQNKSIVQILTFCSSIVLIILVGIELNESCAKNNLNNENIYILLNYWFYFGCVSIIVTVLLYSVYGCLILNFLDSRD